MSVVSTIRGLREMKLADENVKYCKFCHHWTTKGPDSARRVNDAIVECHVCGVEWHIQCGGWMPDEVPRVVVPRVVVCSQECQRQFANGESVLTGNGCEITRR